MLASISRQASRVGAVHCSAVKLLPPTALVSAIMILSTTRTVSSFQAWRVQELDDGSFQGSEQTMSMESLPDHDTLIRVTHSSLNYKDALSAAGNKGVTKRYPHTPGIDAVGVTEAGDSVIVTGYDLGMNTDGGFGEYIRVPREWCVTLPSPWKNNPRQAMVYGTAGLTVSFKRPVANSAFPLIWISRGEALNRHKCKRCLLGYVRYS